MVIISENGAGASPKTKTDLHIGKKNNSNKIKWNNETMGINEEKAHVGSKMEM